MLHRSLQRLAALLVLSIIVAGCGNDGGANVVEPVVVATQQIIVTPSLGRTRGAGVRAVQPDGTTLSDEVDTGGDGRAILQIPASYGGPLIIEMRGKAGATYFDEGSGQEEDFPEGQLLRSAMASPTGEVGLSILTELAVRLAEASGETLDADAINAANERIRAALAPEVADLLTPPTAVDGDTAAGSIDDSDAGQLAARLGALAMLATSDTAPALAILQQLADDVSDGVIDGVGADGMIADPVYMPATFATDFVTAVRDFAAAFGDETLQTSAADATADTSLDADDGDGTDGNDGGTEGGGTAAGACGSNAGPITEAGVDLDFVTNCAGTYTVTETTTGTHTSKSVTIGTDGSITFDTGVAFTAADVVAIFDRISVDRRIQINYGADDDADVIQLFLNEALDAVARIVYRNRTNSIEVDVNVSDDPDAVAEGSGTDAGDGTDAGGGSDAGNGSGSTDVDPDGDGINGTTSAGTVASAFVGSYTLIYSDRSDDNDRDPFMDGEEVAVTIAADGSITIGSIMLSNPFNRSLSTDGSPHLPEIIWYDSTTDLEYALSDNQRSIFNEINVGDASMPQGTFGLPSFLGQLKEPEPPVSESIAPFVGTYTVKLLAACGTDQDCPSVKALGEQVTIVISDEGQITIDGEMFDPNAESVNFFDATTGSVEPSLSLNITESADRSLGIQLYVDQGEIVAVQMLRSVRVSDFSSRNFTIYGELDPLPEAFTQYFTDFIALAPPEATVEMVIIEDSASNTTSADFAASVAFGAPSSLCRSFLIGGEVPTDDSTGSRPSFRWTTANGPVPTFRDWAYRSGTLRTNEGARTLGFNGGQFTLEADQTTITYEEGFTSPATRLVGSPTQTATNNPMLIATTCADYSSITLDIRFEEQQSGTVRIRDTAADAVVFERLYQGLGTGLTTTFSSMFANGTQFEVEVEGFTSNTGTCTVSANGTGTLESDVTVTVTCSGPT